MRDGQRMRNREQGTGEFFNALMQTLGYAVIISIVVWAMLGLA